MSLVAVGYSRQFKRCSMKCRAITLFALAVGLLGVSTPIFAHHGASAYDTKKLTTLKATVTDFQFMNPHSEIFFEVKGADGKVEKCPAHAPTLAPISPL